MRIGICGAQGVGKTTLLNALAEDKAFSEYSICSEVTRWVKSLGYNINEAGGDITQQLIMMKHIENVMMNEKMITDRTILDGLVYTDWLYENTDNVSYESYQYALDVYEKMMHYYDVIFYIEPEFDIEDDGVRSVDVSFRDGIRDLFKEYTEEAFLDGVDVVRISGSVEQRLNQIKETIKIIESLNND